MKFLLAAINAKYIHSNLAVYGIRAYAAEQEKGRWKEMVSIAEYTINHSCSEVVKDIYLKKPDIIGISCYIWNIRFVEEVVSQLSRLMPKLEIWLGGPEVSYRAVSVLEQMPYLRGVMIGEGERTVVSLLQYYESSDINTKEKKSLEEISGICYREQDRIFYNKPEKTFGLSEIPFPYQDLTEFVNRIIYYESSRGCPFSCSYCLSSIEKQLRFRDMEMVKKELQFFLDNRAVQVKFVDRTFNCKREHALEIWRFLLERDNGVTNFHFEIAADLLQEEELALLEKMRPNFIQLEIGVQSANPRTLQAIHRKTDLERLERNVARIRKGNNIHQHLDLIVGLPYEDLQSFAESFCRVYAMQPNQLQIGFLKVLSGTEMEADCQKYGIVRQEFPPYEVLYTNWLTYQEILLLKGIEEMVEQYYNSAQFTHSLTCLVPCFSSPFVFYQTLAEFYQKWHRTGEKHSRIQRYQMLYEFAEGYLKGEEWERFQEALVCDVYLREKAKTRPFFAKERESYKEVVKQFCIREEKKPYYLPDYKGYQSRQIANMIHIERFQHYLTEKGQDTYLLFDYKNRNPLTHEARTLALQATPGGLAPVAEILRLLDQHYTTDYVCYLHHQTPWQLLIATILSAQCTDARVNIVTEDLFVKYPTLEAFANADQRELEQDIHSTGFYKNKAKNIIACTKKLLEEYHGEVPQEIEELTKLAGVGRKTANVIRGNIYHIPSVVVDTHVKRISRKLGLTLEEDPVKIEMDLMKALPQDHWILWNIQIITHGRGVCTAKNPNCGECFLRHLCRAAEETESGYEKKKRKAE